MKKNIYKIIIILLTLLLIADYPVFSFDDSQDEEIDTELLEITELHEEQDESDLTIETYEMNTEETEIEEDIIIFYDFQPTTIEEIQEIIYIYEMLPQEEGIKPHWEFEVDEGIMPEGYYCGYVEIDETFPYPYYTFFKYILTYEEEIENELPEMEMIVESIMDMSLSEASVTVIYAEEFLTALQNQVEEITLNADITITQAIGTDSRYNIVKDLTINGNYHTLTLNNTSGGNHFYLTNSGTLKINNLNINCPVSNAYTLYHVFSLYSTTNAVWNAEFTDLDFSGSGLIGKRYQTNNNSSIGNVTFYGNTKIDVKVNSYYINYMDAVVSAETVTFENGVDISASLGNNYLQGLIYAANDITIYNDIIANITGTGAYHGLLSSENGEIYLNGNANFIFDQSSGASSKPIIKAIKVKFYGNETDINVTRRETNINHNNATLISATEVELGKPNATNLSNASNITIRANADASFFKSQDTNLTNDLLNNFIVNPYTTVNLERDNFYTHSVLSNRSTRTLIEGYINFYFKEHCDFSAKALTSLSDTAVILSGKTLNFIINENASVVLTSSQGDTTNNSGNTALSLRKPDNGCLTFTIESYASLEVVVFGTSTHSTHGMAPIQILGVHNMPNSTSVTTIRGYLSTSANNGNGWYYQYSTLAISGKDIFTVDGGHVNLNTTVSLKRISSSLPVNSALGEYAVFEHFNRNELELNIINGGFMQINTDSWRAMSLAGGEGSTDANAGIRTINIIGSGSLLELNAGQYAISAESYATLYINVLDGGHFYSNNTQDSNIYTTGKAVYTVSGEGSEFRIIKKGKPRDESTTYSSNGAIFHDILQRGSLEIYVKDGGNMYVESNHGSRAAICAQSNSSSKSYVHIIKVTGTGSSLTVINNNTTDETWHETLYDNAFYPIGAITFAAHTSGNIYVENGGNFYAESHNPFSQTIALGGTGPGGVNIVSGTVFLKSPGFFDIRNDSDTMGDIRGTALRGRSYLHSHTDLNRVATSFYEHFMENTQITLNVEHSDVIVYRTNGSNGTPSYTDWSADTIIRSWKNATFTAGNIQTMYNVLNGDGSDAVDGLSAGSSVANSFTLQTYGRITARGGCKVIYEGNGGVRANHRTEYIDGLYDFNSTYYVKSNFDIGFFKQGWIFVRWNTEPDGSGDYYVANDFFTITEDKTLYAIWEFVGENQFVLPLTGGQGSAMFTIIGIILMGVSLLCAFLGFYKRKLTSRTVNNKEEKP